MAFDAIQICFGELNMRAEDHIMKAVQQVDVNVDKEKLIEAIKSKDFVDELIGYIFAYPDDDYMTMECLCRKLHKHGLIDKKDGEWTTNFIDCKTENNSEETNNSTISKMEQVDEPQTQLSAKCLECNNSKACKENHWEDCRYEPLGYEVTAVVGTIKDEPQTDCAWR